jgi:glycosyltransferase involved in cell wall biosynthesis
MMSDSICMLVTRGRPKLAQRAVRCFRRQTWPCRELVIVDDDPDDTLACWVSELADPDIVHIRLPDEGCTLGELRTLSVERATGDYLAQWDDDDICAPERLRVQMCGMLALGAEACTLYSEVFWCTSRSEVFISTGRVWENALICRKDRIPDYPALRRGEDTAVATTIVRGGRVLVLDEPWLYGYGVHGANTFDEAHFEAHRRAATETFPGHSYAAMVVELYRRFALDT